MTRSEDIQGPSTLLRLRSERLGEQWITAITKWRCKCGAKVRVVTEEKRKGSTSEILVACPDCEEVKSLPAERILDVTCERRPLS